MSAPGIRIGRTAVWTPAMMSGHWFPPHGRCPSGYLSINMMYHRCRRRCLDWDVTMAFSSWLQLHFLVGYDCQFLVLKYMFYF